MRGVTETSPKPVVTARVCSLCGLDWKRHGKNPTADKCIELLLAEVRSLNAQLAVRPIPYAQPWPIPYPRPYPVPILPARPYPIYPTWSSGAVSASSANATLPSAALAQPRAIAQHSTC